MTQTIAIPKRSALNTPKKIFSFLLSEALGKQTSGPSSCRQRGLSFVRMGHVIAVVQQRERVSGLARAMVLLWSGR